MSRRVIKIKIKAKLPKKPLNKSHQCIAISKCDVGHIDSILKASRPGIYFDDGIESALCSKLSLNLIDNKNLIGSVSRGLADFLVVYDKSSTATNCINFKLNEPFQNHESVKHLSIHYPFCALLSSDGLSSKIYVRGEEVLLDSKSPSVFTLDYLSSVKSSIESFIKNSDLHYNNLNKFFEEKSIAVNHLDFSSTQKDFSSALQDMANLFFKKVLIDGAFSEKYVQTTHELKSESFISELFFDFGLNHFIYKINKDNKVDYSKKALRQFIESLPPVRNYADALNNPNKLSWKIVVYSSIMHVCSLHRLVKTDFLIESFLRKGVPLGVITYSIGYNKSDNFFKRKPDFFSQEIEDILKSELFYDASSNVLRDLEKMRPIISYSGEGVYYKRGYVIHNLFLHTNYSHLRMFFEKSSSFIKSIKLDALMDNTPVKTKKRAIF